VAQVLEGQGVQVVTAGGAVEDIGLQHGVVGYALEPDAVIGQHAHVVLEVLAGLGPRRVLQQRLEPCQHRLPVKLGRGAHIGMGQGDIGRRPRLHRE